MKKLAFAAALLVAAAMTSAHAEDYPTRTVTIIVPFAPGGPADVTGRVLADILSRHLGQSFVVENIGGAGGTVGSLRAARARPDGYTLILSILTATPFRRRTAGRMNPAFAIRSSGRCRMYAPAP